MTVTRSRLTTKAATVEKALRMSVQGAGKVSKYRNQPTMIDGIRFASKAEGRRYQELRILELVGKITTLQLQKRIDLYASGVKICTYVADFDYYDIERQMPVVEDVKGVLTPEFKLKSKLFKANFGYSITIISGRK